MWLEMDQLRDSRPCLFGGNAHRTRNRILTFEILEDFEEHIKLTITLVQSIILNHFSDDGGCRPNVYGQRVFFSTQEDFWGSVPESNDLERH